MPGVLLVGRFAEDLAIALRHGIATQDEAFGGAGGDVGRLLIGQPSD
jgi:hypothetical protein